MTDANGAYTFVGLPANVSCLLISSLVDCRFLPLSRSLFDLSATEADAELSWRPADEPPRVTLDVPGGRGSVNGAQVVLQAQASDNDGRGDDDGGARTTSVVVLLNVRAKCGRR